MNYSESVSYIESLAPGKELPSLNRIALFLEELDNPQNQFQVIHVGGTNGKGSTAVLIDTLLRSLGQKVGRFTGPHMFSWKERICLNGEFVSSTEFASLATKTKHLSESFADKHPKLGKLSWFEFLTAMAFFKFQMENVDYAVLEVGLGGRFDATNAANNVACTVITNIDLDHTHILGGTVEKIAFEKAGIMKAGVPVFTASSKEALIELKHQAKLKQTEVIDANPKIKSLLDGSMKTDSPILSSADFILKELALLGPHQKINSSLALLALSEIDPIKSLINEHSLNLMQSSLKSIYWPGRMHLVKDKNLIMDVAHNPASAKVLRQSLDQLKIGNLVFLTGFFMSKDVPGFLKNVLRKGDSVIACDLNTKRKFFKASEIKKVCNQMGIECITAKNVKEGLDFFYDKKKPSDFLVATGSFQTIRSTMSYLGWDHDYLSSARAPKVNADMIAK